MTDYGCLKSEYDWQLSRRSDSQFNQTVLSVLFDNNAQRQFSTVRISLLHGKDVATEHCAAWQITPCPSPLSVVNHVSAQDKPVTQNDPSLPMCHIVFIADRHSARSQSIGIEAARLCGEIVLSEPELSTPSSAKFFEFDQVLTDITQSVSISFVSSHRLSTAIPHGVFSEPSSDQPATVGRVVRIISTSERRTISLPTEVLLIIFKSLRTPLSYRGWRGDLLNSALVCHQWTCALSLLLIDFRSQHSQQGHPPEIVGFSNALIARPNLALDIKHLSAGYLETHPTWDPFPILPPGTPSPMFLVKLQLQRSDVRRSRFAKSFLSVLQTTKNVQTLFLDTTNALVVSPSDLAHAISKLTKLDAFGGRCTLSMAQLLSCIATCPSLKRLIILSVLPSSARGPAPRPALSCRLTELTLADVPIKDDELACLMSTSGTTLQRLTLDLGLITQLTNAGLGAALTAVCRSLTYLCVIAQNPLPRAEGEEYALDTTIARMEQLVELRIVPDVASERMVARRAEAFVHQRSSATVLSEIRLHLIRRDVVWDGSLLGAMERDWPGWKMEENLST